ncbi:hypothetical protein FRC17_008027, partial [Serendipita sp. 399]
SISSNSNTGTGGNGGSDGKVAISPGAISGIAVGSFLAGLLTCYVCLRLIGAFTARRQRDQDTSPPVYKPVNQPTIDNP